MIKLPRPIRTYFNAQVEDLLGTKSTSVSFSEGQEEALYPADSLSWRVFKNPVTVFIGGVSAVCMQLAEPRVRSGVWEHSDFKENARGRIQRTGLAAMAKVYAPKSDAKKLIEMVNRMHERVFGETPDGQAYKATDPELLDWVFNTSNYSFLRAYERFGPGASDAEMTKSLTHGAEHEAPLWGVTDAARSMEEALQGFDDMLPKLESHPFIDEFIDIVKKADLMPRYMNPLQRLLVRAAVSNLPENIRAKAGLDKHGLRPSEETLVRFMGRMSDKLFLEAHPAIQSTRRLGLPDDYLFRPVSNDNYPPEGMPRAAANFSHDYDIH